MDYKDIRTNFAGSVSGEVVDNSRSLENIVSANVNWTDIRTAMKYVSKVPRGIRVLVTLIS
jgi:hypothetical protein